MVQHHTLYLRNDFRQLIGGLIAVFFVTDQNKWLVLYVQLIVRIVNHFSVFWIIQLALSVDPKIFHYVITSHASDKIVT